MRRRGTLAILAILMASAGALRLGSGVGAALARVPEASAPAAPMTCPAPPAALAEALRLREAEIVLREKALAERMAAMDLANAAIDRRLAELEAAEAQLSRTLALADGAAESDLARLTAVYESMKPKEAATLFQTMDPEFAAGFLGRMRPEAAGAILSGMPPDTAYAVSVLLAGRNSAVPTE